MDLFDFQRERKMQKDAPLAVRMRPRSLDEFVGQEHILGEGRVLRSAIENDTLSSLILFGPPGSGKTALAHVIAGTTAANFVQVNAVTTGVATLRDIIARAKEELGMYGRRTILFIDEIHRFNKAQQDALLPDVESGAVILIGATTQNPFFEVNSPLISRSRILKLEPLSKESILKIVRRAMQDKERGLGAQDFRITDHALDYVAEVSRGDARIALNVLELAAQNRGGKEPVDVAQIEDCVQQRAVSYDKSGDNHYDVISAFIKSLRGSDPDAAVHWLARMLEAGEDPRFICRRMIILASEDIGLADPHALGVAVAAAQALDYIGLPEARLNMAHAAIYLACCPKSNSVINAIDGALADVRGKDIGSVPPHLRDANYPGASELGHGIGYKYPHSFPGNYVEQQYLPDPLLGVKYYLPGSSGMEKKIRDRKKE